MATRGQTAPSSASDGASLASDNGQTGSLGDDECIFDAECRPVLETWAGGDAEFVLVDSACEHAEFRQVPVCVCVVSVTRSERAFLSLSGEVGRGTREELYVLENDELRRRRGPACAVPGNVPGSCAYCEHEFPGCDVDASVNDCAVPCADAVERLRADALVAHDVELLLARCTAGRCESVVRIDDACYGASGNRTSCSLDDDVSAARANPGDQCGTPPLPCNVAEDCPAALACNGSVCGACKGPDDACTELDPNCGTGFVCATGEVCSAGRCIRTERAECLAHADCPTTDPVHAPRMCRLTSTNNVDGRGNEQTRSVCSSAEPH